jgi:hypothetical protein
MSATNVTFAGEMLILDACHVDQMRWALLWFGQRDDPRVRKRVEWATLGQDTGLAPPRFNKAD